MLTTRLAAQRVNQLFNAKLTYRQREVVKLRSGLGDGMPYSRPECAYIFETTVDTIGRIEKAAIKKLKAECPMLWDLVMELGKMRQDGVI